jgi:tRNA A37 threonylcarbamoyladenosine dehydratase
VSGGAAGRLDPTRIRVGDLAQVRGDAFLAATRKLLRKQHGFPAQGAWSLPAVHSLEPARPPRPLAYDGDEGFVCVCPQGGNGLHTCEHRNVIWGTAGYVTGAFGLACAAAAVEQLLNGPGDGRSGQ